MTSKGPLQPPLFYDCNSPEKHARFFSLIKSILKIAKLTVSIIAYVEQADFDSKLCSGKQHPRITQRIQFIANMLFRATDLSTLRGPNYFPSHCGMK